MVTLQPTYNGFVETREDVMILIQACSQGYLRPIHRRPGPADRPCIVQSGHIFLWEETATGIRRWWDGAPWTASRVLVDFLLYAERSDPKDSPRKLRPRQASEPATGQGLEESISEELHTRLYGSLQRSFDIKTEGLIKKTISIKDCGESGPIYHLVSYYRPVDVLQGVLRTPSMDESFAPQQWHHCKASIPRTISSDDQQVLSNSALPPLRPYPQPDSSTPTVFRQYFDNQSRALQWERIPIPTAVGRNRYPVHIQWTDRVYQVQLGSGQYLF